MTHSGGKPHTDIGDRGQRYEVRYSSLDDNGQAKPEVKVFGWAITLGGAATMVSAINLHPSMTNPRVWDRVENKEVI